MRSDRRNETKRRAPAGVQSVEIGLSILDALIDLEQLPMLKTIAERAGMPPAKAHRYLVSFCRAGFVEKDPQTGRYRIGTRSLRLGLAAMSKFEVAQIARPLLPQICADLGQSVLIAVWGSTGPIIVLIEHAPGLIMVTARVGYILPLLSSATGRIFAAWLPRIDTRELLGRELAQASRTRPEGVPHTLKEAEALFEEVRKRGLARIVGQLSPVVHALSAPIFDHTGKICAVLSTLGPAGSFSTDWNGPLARKLKVAAADLSSRLGHADSRNEQDPGRMNALPGVPPR